MTGPGDTLGETRVSAQPQPRPAALLATAAPARELAPALDETIAPAPSLPRPPVALATNTTIRGPVASSPALRRPSGLLETTAPLTDPGPFRGEPPPRAGPGELAAIGRFVVLRELGHGAMGVVYAAYDEELDRKVALKLLRVDVHGDASLGRNQLLREAQALARLAHPNVVAVHEAGVHAGGVYIAMEYVQGIDLQAWMAAEPRPWRAVVAVFRQAGEGLLAAHRRGLVHRDFKPSNVLVGDDGRVRVADFGLATHRGAPGPDPGHGDGPGRHLGETIAGDGALIGTPAYMAPEQLRREPATPASDQFAFCVALYEALHGARPFTGDTIEALARALEAPALPATPPRPDVPRWLHAALLRGLARDPARRYPSLAELLALLARDPELARQRARQRALLLLLTVVLTVLAVLGGARIYEHLARRAADARADARLATLEAQLAPLHAAGRDDEAARLLHAFADLPDNRGTPALSAAYRGWAGLQTDHAVAVDALASAYVAAIDPAAEQAALRGLVARLTARGAHDEAAAALATLDARAPELAHDADLAPARIAAALHRHDLAAARDALADLGPDDPRRAYIPVLENMSHGTAYDYAHFAQDEPSSGRFTVADVDGDGREDLAARGRDGRGGGLHRLAPGLPRFADFSADHVVNVFAVAHALTGAPTVLVEAELDPQTPHSFRLLQLAPAGPPRELLRWDDSPGPAPIVVDLDGDGVPALFYGSGAYQRRLSRVARGPDGAWTRDDPDPRTNAMNSDINAVTAADLDGDGRPELLVALGPWNAYDLRVLRAGPDGALDLVTRRTFGSIAGLVPVRVGSETLIAVAKVDDYPNPPRFGPDAPAGEPAGLSILALRGDALELRQFIPERPPDAPPRQFRALHVADLDGDGQDDLASADGDDTLLLLRAPDRFLEPLRLHGVRLHQLADIDADPQAELLAHVRDGEPHFVLLGEGDVPLPPRSGAAPVVRPPPVALDDPAIAAAWGHAEELAAIGLTTRSAAELAAIAGLSGHVRGDILLRAAELYTAAGAHAEAAPLFLAAADRPDLADAALAGAERSRRALGEFAAAVALVDARLELPDLAPDARAEAEAERARLRSATAPRPERHLRFAGPLDPDWHIHDPLAAARAPATAALSLRTSPAAVVAELPLVWDGGTLELGVRLEVDDLEWGNALEVGLLRPDAPAPWLSVRVRCEGASDAPNVTGIVDTHLPNHEEHVPLTGVGRLYARIQVYPELGATIITVDVPGRPARRRVLPFTGPAHAGPMRLALRTDNVSIELVGQIRVTAIDLVGLRPGAPAGPPDPWARVARLIAENELTAALAGLDDVAVGTPPALWRADLLARLGHAEAAAAALRHALGPDDVPSPLSDLMIQRLRRPRDAFLSIARGVLGDEYLDVRYGVILQHMAVRPDLIADALTDLAELPLAPPPGADLGAIEAHIERLLTRTHAWRLAGRNDLARRDLDAVWAILERHAVPARKRLRRDTTRLFVAVAADLGEIEDVRHWMRVDLAIRSDPAIELEIMRNQPALAALLHADDWAALAQDARRLAAERR